MNSNTIEEALDLVKKNGQSLQNLNDELRNNKEIVLAAINQYCYALRFASEQIKSDQEVVFSAVNQNPLSLQYASEKLLNDRQFIKMVVKKDGMALQYVGENLQTDKELVLLALSNNGMALKYVNNELREDVEVISTALKQEQMAMEFVSYAKRAEFGLSDKYFGSYDGYDNRDVVLFASKKDISLLQYASKRILNDKKFILDIVKHDGMGLQYASKNLQGDLDVILTAIGQNKSSMRFVNYNKRNLLNDSYKYFGSYTGYDTKSIVLKAIEKDGLLLQYASDKLINDKQLVLVAVKNDGMALQFASRNLQDDLEIILAALEQNKSSMKFASHEKQIQLSMSYKSFGSYSGYNNKNLILSCLEYNASLFKYISIELQNDEEVVCKAISNDGMILQFVNQKFRCNMEILITAVTHSGLSLQYADDAQRNNRNVVLAAVQQNGLALQYAHEKLLDDKEIVLAAVQQNALALEFASSALKSNHEIVATSVSKTPESLSYASNELQNDASFLILIIKNNASLIKFIDNKFIKDAEFLCHAVQINEQSVLYLGEIYKDNKHLMFLLLSYNYKAFKFLQPKFQNDINFLAEAYRQEPNFSIEFNLQLSLEVSSLKLEKVIYKKFANYSALELNSPTSQEVTKKMNQLSEAISRIKQEMQDNYPYIDEYYAEKFTSVISPEHFDQLKIEFIQDWYKKTIPDHIEGDNKYKKIKIDDQQALVIGSVSKNTKVTARAGSGKTATLVLRALFLKSHCRIDFDKMLIMAFNNSAAETINNRINKYLKNINPDDYKNQNEEFKVASTFHSFAHGIVNESHKELELVTDDHSEKENTANIVPANIIKTIFQTQIQSNHEQISKVKKIIFEHSSHFDNDIVDEKQNSLNSSHLNNPIAEKNLKGINGYSYDNQEDKTIANWLTCCGIEFKYNSLVKTKNGGTQEISFVLDNTKNKKNKTHIIDLRISKDIFKNKLDHRYELIDLNINDVVEIMNKFVNSIECKRCNQPMKDCGYEPPSGICRNIKCQKTENVGLQCVLCKKNELTVCCKRCEEHCLCIPTITANFSFLSNEEIWSEYKDDLLKHFLNAINNFIKKCRALKISPDDLAGKIGCFDFKPYYTKDFAEVALVVYRSYLHELEVNKRRDFTLTVDLASRELNGGNCKYAGGKKDVRDLKFVFVDEYQDFSVLFNDLVQGIIKNNPKVLTFCVGDDWQAINGFAGSDLKFFTNFKDYFASPLELNMVTNYRSDKNIVEAGNFVMSGNGAPSQSSSAEAGNIYIVNQNELEPLNSKEETYFGRDKVSPYIYRIVKRLLDQGKKISILSRGKNPKIKNLKIDKKNKSRVEELVEELKRFFSNINIIESDNGITISSNLIEKGSTVHKYKGQESEAIILLAPYSFSSIHQDWVFYQILGDTLEEIVQAERRLFYVAVTRAKQDLYLIGDAGNDNVPFIDRAKWTDYGLISEINIQNFRALEKFPAETIHITVQTPNDFGNDKWSNLRTELFKNQGFTWIEKLKIWTKDFSITNICNSNTNDQDKFKLFSVWLIDIYNSGLNFTISAYYADTMLFKDQFINKKTLPLLKNKVFYFMNLLAIDDYKVLETKIKMTGVFDFFEIRNAKTESFLFYLVNYDSNKLDLVLKIISNDIGDEHVKKIITAKNNVKNNIFDKAVLIGNFDVVKYLVREHLNTPNFIDFEKNYISNNTDVVKFLIDNNIKSTEKQIINDYYIQLSPESRYENLIHFLNYRLPLEYLLKSVLDIPDKFERYLELEHVIKVCRQDDINELQKTDKYYQLPIDIKAFIDSYSVNNWAEEIKDELRTRRITELVHFTNMDNLESIFINFGIYSIKKLRDENIKYLNNDTKRLDGLYEYICCSITNVNHYYFHKYLETSKFYDFCIIKINPRIIYKEETLYSVTSVEKESNNHELRYTGKTYNDFCMLFQNNINIDGNYKKRPPNIADNITTDDQAEVLIHDSIHYYDIKEIVVKDERTKNKCERILEAHNISWISLKIDESVFNSKKNTYAYETESQIDDRKINETIDDTLAHDNEILPF